MHQKRKRKERENLSSNFGENSDEMKRFNIREHALNKRASHVLRVRLGVNGQGSLVLQGTIFSRTMSSSFTDEERNMMGRDVGFTVPTMDECGRIFQVQVFHNRGTYYLRGWRRLTFINNFDENTIISLWIYRERLSLGPNLEVPRFIVTREGRDKFFCSECRRCCVHWD